MATPLKDEQTEAFIGKSRHDALSQIEGGFDYAVEEDRATVVVVSGLSGSGKTRLAQEFFNRLAHRQSDPVFWPRRFNVAESGRSLLKYRHQLHPVGDVHPTARRSFSWYAQACRRSSDEPGLAIEGAFESHRRFMQQHPKRKNQRLMTYVSIGIIAAAITVEFIDNFVSLPTPLQWCARIAGGASFIYGLKNEWQKFIENRAVSRRNTAADTTSAIGVLEESFGLIRLEVERFRTPTVVLIDDWHWADESTQSFVSELCHLNGPCLILLTRWLTGNEFDQATSLMNDIESVALMTIELPQLEMFEVTEILQLERPNFDMDLHHAIAEHSAGNPLIALKLCSLPQVDALAHRKIDSGQIRKIISELPFDHEGILREHWRAVPLEVQQFLSVASIYGEVIPTELAKKTFAIYFTADPSRAVQLAREPYWWLQMLQQDIDTFPESSLYRIAKEQAALVLGRDVLQELETTVASTLDNDLPPSLRVLGIYGDTLAERRLSLRLARKSETSSLDDVRLVWHTVMTLGGSRFVDLRQRLCREQIKWLTNNSPSAEQASEHQALLIQLRYYEFKTVFAESPHVGKELGLALLNDIGNHPLRADLLLRLGNICIELQDFESATAFYQQVLGLGPPDDIREAAIANSTLVLARSGQLERAIGRLLRDRRRRQIRIAPLLLVTGLSRRAASFVTDQRAAMFMIDHNIGAWYGRNGDAEKALAHLRKALRRAEKIEITAENREKTWKSKSLHAYWTFKSGDLDGALQQFAEITEQSLLSTAISPQHPEAISAIQTYAACLACAGNHSAATQLLAQLTEKGAETETRISADAGLRERQEFIETHLHRTADLVEYL